MGLARAVGPCYIRARRDKTIVIPTSASVKFISWVRGVARLTRLPVTEKTEGSNPFGPAIQKHSRNGSVFAHPTHGQNR